MVFNIFDKGEEKRLLRFLENNKKGSFSIIEIHDINIQNFTSLSLLKNITILCLYRCNLSNIKFPENIRDIHVENSCISGILEFPLSAKSIIIERTKIEKLCNIHKNVSTIHLEGISLDHPFLEILPRTLEELILHDIQNVPLKLLPKLKKLSMCKVTFLENPRFLCKYLPDSLEYLELKDINTDSVYKIQPNIKNIITYDIDNICIIHSHLTKLRKEMVTLQTGDYIRNRIIPLRKTFLHGISLFRRSTDITDTCSDIISRYYYNKKIKSKLSRYLLDVSIENIYNPYHPNCVILRLFTKNNISL